MTNLTSLIALISLLSPVSHDAKQMQGVWVPTKWTFAGSSTPPPTMGAMKLMVRKDQFEFVEGASHDFGHLVLRADKKPREMDIVGVKGPNAGKTIPSIYEFRGQDLVICYGLDGHRPKAFESPAKALVLLAVFSRAK